MRVDWAIPCRFVEVVGGLANVLGAGIDTYWLKEIPGDLQVLLAVRFVAAVEDLAEGQSHTIMVRILDPEMNLISELPATLPGVQGQGRLPGWEAGFILPVVQRFRVETPGVYTIDLAVEGKTRSVSLAIEHGPPPGT